MASTDKSFRIKVDLAGSDAGASATLKAVHGQLDELESGLDALRGDTNAFDALLGDADKLSDELQSVKTAAAGVHTELAQGGARAASGAKQMAAGMEAATSATRGASKESQTLMMNIGRLISDAPFGLLGLSNNLAPLAESFQRASASAGGARAAIGGVIAAIGGPAGLAMIGIPVVTSLALMFGDDLVRAVSAGGESLDQFKARIEGISEYRDFTLEVKIAGLSRIEQLERKLDTIGVKMRMLRQEESIENRRQALGSEPGGAFSWFTPGGAARQMARAPQLQALDAEEKAMWQERGRALVQGVQQAESRGSSANLISYGSERNSLALQALGYTEKQITLFSERWALLAEKTGVSAEKNKPQPGVGSRSGGGMASSGGRSGGRDQYSEVLSSLDEERLKLTLTSTEYDVYTRVKQAGVAAGSAQAKAIRAEVESLDALRKAVKDQKDSAAADEEYSAVIEALQEERKQLGMTSTELKAYQLIKKAGVAEDSERAVVIRAEVEANAELAQSYKDAAAASDQMATLVTSRAGEMYRALSDGIQGFSYSMTSSFNDMIWKADQSFGDILESFGQMITQMLIQSAVVSPLTSSFSGLFSSAGLDADISAAVAANPAAFANGGVMSKDGPAELRRYAGGGVASSPQTAVFGEGSNPEAFVPLPDGRSIPVDWRGGSTVQGSLQNLRISIVNQGGQQLEVASAEPQMDMYGMTVTIMLKAMQESGPVQQRIKSISRGA